MFTLVLKANAVSADDTVMSGFLEQQITVEDFPSLTSEDLQLLGAYTALPIAVLVSY